MGRPGGAWYEQQLIHALTMVMRVLPPGRVVPLPPWSKERDVELKRLFVQVPLHLSGQREPVTAADGLAAAQELAHLVGRHGGTPEYMAPEEAGGVWFTHTLVMADRAANVTVDYDMREVNGTRAWFRVWFRVADLPMRVQSGRERSLE